MWMELEIYHSTGSDHTHGKQKLSYAGGKWFHREIFWTQSYVLYIHGLRLHRINDNLIQYADDITNLQGHELCDLETNAFILINISCQYFHVNNFPMITFLI